MTVAVCDSGPLTHLWQINAWPAFGTFKLLHLAPQVVQEVQTHVPLSRFEDIADCALQIHQVSQSQIESARQKAASNLTLQEADLAMLALVNVRTPDLVLTDDLSLRRAVEAAKFTPMGSVGILLRAYNANLFDEPLLDQAIDSLFVHSTLYLSAQFKSYVRRLIAEAIARHQT